MCNSIFIDNKTIPKAKDGEEFELTVKGVYHTEDGVRKLDIMTVDGKDVIPPDESDCGCDDHEDLMNQDSDDALRLFIIKTDKAKKLK